VKTITMMEFRSHPGEIFDRMKYFHEVFRITNSGRPVGYLIPAMFAFKPTAEEIAKLLKDESVEEVHFPGDGSVVCRRNRNEA
jgi:PHD/YefM family antitoxin component YafN of YafNO toxin-antitoxin module